MARARPGGKHLDEMMAVKLKKLRQRPAWCLASVLVLGPVTVLKEQGSGSLGAVGSYVQLVALSWVVMAAVLWVLSVCPRCKNMFFVSGLRGNPFSRRCMNCGLPLYTVRDN